jgi:hypothetical protein
MTVSIRVSDTLFDQAVTAGRFERRSPPGQIEFWAELGQRVANSLAPTDYLALLQGIAELRIERRRPPTISADAVFATVERERLIRPVTQAEVRYEASRSHPGLVDRINAQGERTPGRFVDGVFVSA